MPHTPAPWPRDYVQAAVRHIARNCDFIESAENPEFGWDRYNDADVIWAAPDLADAARLALPLLAAYRSIARNGRYAKQVAAADALEAALAKVNGGTEEASGDVVPTDEYGNPLGTCLVCSRPCHSSESAHPDCLAAEVS
jgi:hypothetical protein